MSTVNITFRERLRLALDRDTRPRKSVASLSGYSEGYIRRVLAGTKPNPTINFAAAMAQVLGVSLAWLVGGEPETA